MTNFDSLADVRAQVRSILSPDLNYVANAANLCAVAFRGVPGVNWIGFYFRYRNELIVGPYQGAPACSRLPLTKGVCGQAFRRGQVVNVPDVQNFESHIACDTSSLSELVIPLRHRGRIVGVLDIDSPVTARFHQHEVALFKGIANDYERSICLLEAKPALG